jgi:DNA-binding transcriptional regulator PaaX
MNAQQIVTTIKNNDAAMSAKGIVAACKIDADSAELNRIVAKCWELVEQGELVAFDTRDQEKGGLFFDVKRGG